MTVCIAAACKIGASNALVVCSDWLISGALGKTENKLKIRSLATSWNCLTAGEESEINALARVLEENFAKRGMDVKLNEREAVTLVANAVGERKLEKIEELVRSQYGISYHDLKTIGKEKLPPELYRELIEAIRDTGIGAEFIIAGFNRGYPLILTTQQNGRVRTFENFAVVGEGAYLAQTVLMHRGQNDMRSLDSTLYAVFESKKYAEGAPSVGSRTAIAVLYPDKQREILTTVGLAYLEKSYEELGPKKLPNDMLLPKDSLAV